MSGARERPRVVRHQLRHRADDPPFSRAVLEDGLDSRDLLELDLRVSADGEWACLHDAVLDRETTGTGAVSAATRAQLSTLRMRLADGTPGEPALLLDEVVARAACRSRREPAFLQLDLKVPADALGDRAIRRVRALAGPLADRFVVSSTDWAAVMRVARAVPGLRCGFDPAGLATCDRPRTAADFARLRDRMFATAPGADICYVHWQLVLEAAAAGCDFVAAAHARGARVAAWTVDPGIPGLADVVARLVGLGIDAITTNDRDALGAVLDGLAPQPSAEPTQAGLRPR